MPGTLPAANMDAAAPAGGGRRADGLLWRFASIAAHLPQHYWRTPL